MIKYEITKKKTEKLLMAGVRVKQRYDEMVKDFEELAQKLGEIIAGPAFTLYFDEECKEIADYEVCFPVKEIKNIEGVSFREIEGGECLTTIYTETFENAKEAWEELFKYISEKGYIPKIPSREVYIKCPNDNKEGEMETEIQVYVK